MSVLPRLGRHRGWSVILAFTLVFSIVAAQSSLAVGARTSEARVAPQGRDLRVPTAPRLSVEDLSVDPLVRGEPIGDIMDRWLNTAGFAALAIAADRDPLSDDGFSTLDLEDASPLPYPLVVDSMSTTDTIDVFRVYAAPGEQILVYSESAPTIDVDIALWGSEAASVSDPMMIYAGDFGAGESEFLCYTVPAGAKGYHYIGAVNSGGTGSGLYGFAWTVTSRSDGNIGSYVPFPDDGFTDDVDLAIDQDDAFSVNLAPGQTIDVTLTVDVSGDARMLMFDPTATDTWVDTSIEEGVSHVSHTVGPGEGGVYCLDVWARNFAVDYDLEWSVDQVNIPGRSANALPLTVTGDSVFYVDLLPGQSIDVDISVIGPGNAVPKLFDRDAIDVTVDTPLTTGSSPFYTCAEGEGGRYYLFIDAIIGTQYNLDITTSATVQRIAGDSRYLTNVRSSEADFPDGADVVIVARGDNFPDALSASALAGAYDAPILLTRPSYIDPATLDEIERLGATRCFVVGGTAAVNASVVAQIDALPGMRTPVRLSGVTRYGTAAAVAEHVFTRQGVLFYGLALLARGDRFPDALAFSPIAWGVPAPVLLTRTDSLAPETADFIELGETRLVAIGGGYGAVSSAVETEVADLVVANSPVTADPPTLRLAGEDRYETAYYISWWSAFSPFVSPYMISLATGTSFPDALGGGAAIANQGGLMMLTRPTYLDEWSYYFVDDFAGLTKAYQVFGGTGAVSDDVIDEVYAIQP